MAALRATAALVAGGRNESGSVAAVPHVTHVLVHDFERNCEAAW
jgi:hypothetical protein